MMKDQKMSCWRKKTKKKNSEANQRQRLFQENGKVLLEDLIELCNGKSNPIKTFSAEEILEATDNFSESHLVIRFEFMYRGMLQNRPVLIKRATWNLYKSDTLEKICRDIAVSSMVSGHKNFLKLLGCCLEFEHPVLVCEYAERIPYNSPNPDMFLSWGMRIKIAKEIAIAVSYLHTAYSRTMIHTDIQPSNVFLDSNGTAKLSGFCLCVSIPEGETFVKDKKNKKKKSSDLKNGGILLEELIASFDGKTNPIRCFSSDQILKATDNFSESRIISSWGYFIWYRGVIEDRPVSIKKWSSQNLSTFTEAYRDISVSSQMSGHKNALKLLGCCLEFDLPALVCEYTEHGPLNRDGGISSGEVLPWKVRLKIAREIASSVTYLHTAFPETIIHRNINPTNIFIDKNWTAKLSDFWFCVAIPEGELYVEDDVKGVIGFVDPDYYWTMKVTEKVDIYSFGVVMLVLLSGRAAVFNGPDEAPMSLNDHVSEVRERNGFEEIVDKEIWNDLGGGDDLVLRRSQVEAFLRLALRCVRYKKEDPVSSMLEVAKELKLIERLS